jgi:hypothetical protein
MAPLRKQETLLSASMTVWLILIEVREALERLAESSGGDRADLKT